MRSRRIREKYVGLWLTVALAVVILGAFPGLAFWLAKVVGVQTPANLIFSAALTVLLIVCIQLSVALSSLEERARTLTEEIALLRQELDVIRRGERDREATGASQTQQECPTTAQVEDNS